MQKQINTKKCPTEREMNEQVFFDSEKCGRKRKIWRCLHQFVGWKQKNFGYITTGKPKMRKLEKPFFKIQKNKTKQEK